MKGWKWPVARLGFGEREAGGYGRGWSLGLGGVRAGGLDGKEVVADSLEGKEELDREPGRFLRLTGESTRPALSNAAEADRSILKQKSTDLRSPPPVPDIKCSTYASYLAYHWANDNDTRAALHVKEGTVKEWQICRDDFPYDDALVNSSIPYHHDLIARGYRALVFSGDHDLTVPFLGTMEWIGSLNLSIIEPWRSWHVNGQVGGYTVRYSKNLTYATVKGGGHEPAKDRNMETSALFNRWISHKSL
ncbi:Serine carboxypeptidase-like 10 [Dendrobium catenatum]|uniref:Serine carboxypeptidase-like 10 n=1 Tax=Dendrobium catenatum TaxID=906689 RepID=A0A2I0X6D3_9ASPA|nr:Serine carboxypeptidase-like 10 [Dendrobium catenatum]